MKLAYFAPLPPKKTGVAAYAAHLAVALAEHASIDFFDNAPSLPPLPGTNLIDYIAAPEKLLTLPRYDAVLYQLGNNPEFHAHIFNALLACPGPVILHDSVLYFLIAGLGKGGMLREFLCNEGSGAAADFFAIIRESPEQDVLRYRDPARYPMLSGVLKTATRIIVHSRTSAALVRSAGYVGPIDVIPHLAYPVAMQGVDPALKQQTRLDLGLCDGELLLGSFGFFGATKRFPSIFRALGRLRSAVRFKFLVVGEGGDLTDLVSEAGLADRTILRGYVDDQKFSRLLGSTDILINPRFPSMGETSGPLIQAMAAGIPSVVSDLAWFGELPDEAVAKVPTGEHEADGIEAAVHRLATDEELRRAMGEAARRHIQSACAPQVVAAQFATALSEGPRPSPQFYPSRTLAT